MAITYPITLSTTEPNSNIGLLKIRQADEETQTLDVTLLESGNIRSYEGLQVFFCARIGQTVGLGIIEQKLNPEEMTNPKAGQLKYTFRAEDWQVLGRQTGYFSFRKMKDDHTYVQQFSTRDFTYEVTKSIYSDGIKEVTKDGSTYVWTFEDLLRLLQEFKDSGETDFLAWFDEIKDQLSEDAAGNLMLLYQSLRDKTGSDNDFRPFESELSFMKRVYNETRERGFNPKWAGAKADGLTNDAPVVQTILNSYQDINFLNKEYYLDQDVVVDDQTINRMAIVNGTFVGNPLSQKPIKIIIKRSNVHIENCTFKDCSLVIGNEDAITRWESITMLNVKGITDRDDLAPFDIKCVKDFRMDNVIAECSVISKESGIKFHNNKNDLVQNPSMNVSIEHSRVSGFYRGIDCLGTGYRSNFSVKDNTIENCTQHGIFMYHTEGGRCDDNRVLSCGYGIWFDGGALSTKYFPQSCSNNSLNNILKGYGIYVEETHGALIHNNNIRNCFGIGILLSAGNEYTKIADNIIKNVKIGIAIDNTFAPSEIQGYFNLDIKIGENIIENAEYEGIYIRLAYRSLRISNNIINSCNTKNTAYGFAINVEKCDSVDVVDNTLNNYDASTVTKGYHSGVSVGIVYSDDRTAITNTLDIGKVNLINNTGVNISKYSFYLGNTGVSQGVNTAGIINGNSFVGDALCVIKYPNTFVFSGNLGLAEFSALISNTGDKLLKLSKGVAALPTASLEYEGCIAKMARTTSKDTSYYICKQNAAGSYVWKEIFI